MHSPDPADPVSHPAGDHDHAGGGVLRYSQTTLCWRVSVLIGACFLQTYSGS